ncbi:MAG: pyruvate carboxyltransferase, partial [Cryptosporangiaceae bacterium]|nr:pyruvate carboxyltransferase [Cryptosporangiaceae bacterium]
LCASMDVDTGISLEAYLGVVDRVVALTGRRATSFVTRGGTRDQLARASWPVAPPQSTG